MDTMLAFVGLVITTLMALFAALALQTLLLRAAFALMHPATASRRIPQPKLGARPSVAEHQVAPHGRMRP